jgi:uncharacterized iron-regulated membrane protein
MKKIFQYGGVITGVVMIAFGIGAVAMGTTGFFDVRNTLAQENIVGTPDSTIPGQKVDTGAKAKAFADVMRHHTLEATGGQTYADMGRYLDKQGKPTNDAAVAAVDPKTGQPVENGLRQMWVTETALTTALNMAYMAERVALFGIVVGFALLLSGIGFIVLTVGGALRREPRKAAAAPITVGRVQPQI